MEKRTSLLSHCLNVVTTKSLTSNWCPRISKLGVGMLESKSLFKIIILLYNLSVMSSDTISIESCLLNKPSQHSLSDKLEAYSLFDSMLCAHRAKLLSVSSPHAAAWLTVTPSVSLGLHLDPNEPHTAI